MAAAKGTTSGRDLDGRDEAIPLARYRLDELRRVRGIAQRLPKLADRGVDTVLDVDEHVLAPERVHDFTPRDELVSPPNEQDQQIHGLPLESDATSVAAQLVGRYVEREVAKVKGPAGAREGHLLVGSTIS